MNLYLAFTGKDEDLLVFEDLCQEMETLPSLEVSDPESEFHLMRRDGNGYGTANNGLDHYDGFGDGMGDGDIYKRHLVGMSEMLRTTIPIFSPSMGIDRSFEENLVGWTVT